MRSGGAQGLAATPTAPSLRRDSLRNPSRKHHGGHTLATSCLTRGHVMLQVGYVWKGEPEYEQLGTRHCHSPGFHARACQVHPGPMSSCHTTSGQALRVGSLNRGKSQVRHSRGVLPEKGACIKSRTQGRSQTTRHKSLPACLHPLSSTLQSMTSAGATRPCWPDPRP